jgi:tripartite-type tricarboxylate transporter receptor subunit TctC
LISSAATHGTFLATRKVDYKNSDFEQLAQYLFHPLGIAVNSDAPWKTLEELVEDAKKNPGKLKYGISGFGVSAHFAMELFKSVAGGLKMDFVPYKSGPEVVAALLGGHVHTTFLYMVDLKGAYEGGRVRIFATGTEKRLEDYPNIPTCTELGYPGVILSSWHGIAAPVGLPREVSDKLKDALYKTIKHPDVIKMLSKLGYAPTFKDSEEFTKFVIEEEKKYHRIVKEAGIKLQD